MTSPIVTNQDILSIHLGLAFLEFDGHNLRNLLIMCGLTVFSKTSHLTLWYSPFPQNREQGKSPVVQMEEPKVFSVYFLL
jgi:hypothetical protein